MSVGDEHVSGAAHGLQARLLGRVFDLAAQAGDLHVDGALGILAGLVAGTGATSSISSMRLTGGVGKAFQQACLVPVRRSGTCPCQSSPFVGASCRWPSDSSFDQGSAAGTRRRMAATQKQFARPEGFGQIVVGAAFKALDPVAGLALPPGWIGVAITLAQVAGQIETRPRPASSRPARSGRSQPPSEQPPNWAVSRGGDKKPLRIRKRRSRLDTFVIRRRSGWGRRVGVGHGHGVSGRSPGARYWRRCHPIHHRLKHLPEPCHRPAGRRR